MSDQEQRARAAAEAAFIAAGGQGDPASFIAGYLVAYAEAVARVAAAREAFLELNRLEFEIAHHALMTGDLRSVRTNARINAVYDALAWEMEP